MICYAMLILNNWVKTLFKVLEEVGILCQNQEMLEALEKRGAKVDYAKPAFNTSLNPIRKVLLANSF